MSKTKPTLRSAHPGFCVFCGFLLPLGDANCYDQTHITCKVCKSKAEIVNLRSVQTASGETVMHLIEDHQKILLEQTRRDYIQPTIADDASLNTADAKQRGVNVIEHECSKCGYDQAECTAKQMRSADEGQTIFYKCLKCGHTEKEADT